MKKETRKLSIDMLSRATSAPAQGVGSVYIEETRLIEELGKNDFDLAYNKHGHKYDLYHVHSVNPQYYSIMKRKNCASICFVHFLPNTLEGSIRLPKWAFKLFCAYVTKFYKAAKEIVVVNPSFIPDLVKFGIDRERITYIPNFVSQEDFFKASEEKKKEFREKYHIPQDKFVVLGVGQVQTRKGILDFIDVAKKNPDMYFIWAGGFSFGAITEGYKNLKKEMETKRDNLSFLGIRSRSEMQEIYNAADCFLLPSYNELFPMALLENCNIGNPYVVRNLSIYEDILIGDYPKADDNLGFSKELRRLKNDHEYYQKATLLAKQMADKYSRENVYLLWRDYYRRIYLKYHPHDKIDFD